MSKSNILVGLVLLLYILFIGFEVSGETNIAFLLSSLLVPVITVGYIFFSKRKNVYFLLFLVLYSISDILGVTVHYILYYNFQYVDSIRFYELDYYIGSSMYILGYLLLSIVIVKTISFKHVLKNFKIHLVVLTALNIYLIYVLQFIVESNIEYRYEYYVELVYNVVMLLFLSIALISYFYRDNKKSLYLFVAALFIVFSEVLDVAYNYIDQRALLSVIGTSLALCAFYFFYQQARFRYGVRHQEEERYALLDEC
ncbi:hypothetical protein [Cognatitamlana onchidii]|uniref:hypothetical protein n=1 Tax=Cognatitamlana onchidii TaxID=2562860 RepID=UPI0010A65875|nr:hypothetical protein [Algibacter onchidii]